MNFLLLSIVSVLFLSGCSLPNQSPKTVPTATKSEVTTLEARINLGNTCYDANQYQKAIDAYSKALEIDPKNPDVITDQGSMYYQLGDYENAFKKYTLANKIDPMHLNSLFNLGVLYLVAYKNEDSAIKTWNKIIERSPNSEKAKQAQSEIEKLKLAK